MFHYLYFHFLGEPKNEKSSNDLQTTVKTTSEVYHRISLQKSLTHQPTKTLPVVQAAQVQVDPTAVEITIITTR